VSEDINNCSCREIKQRVIELRDRLKYLANEYHSDYRPSPEYTLSDVVHMLDVILK